MSVLIDVVVKVVHDEHELGNHEHDEREDAEEVEEDADPDPDEWERPFAEPGFLLLFLFVVFLFLVFLFVFLYIGHVCSEELVGVREKRR